MAQSITAPDSCAPQAHSCNSVRQKAKPAFNTEKGKGTDEADSTGCTDVPLSDAALDRSRQIKVTLMDASLWKKFKDIINEMIVTKPGRRLFPGVMISLSGLKMDEYYELQLKIASSDGSRYKYLNRKWEAMGESEIRQNEAKQSYKHPSSPNTGQFWTKKPVSFKSVKISHYDTANNGNILLHTMHKYHVEIVIIPYDKSRNSKLPEISIPLPDTTFIAVSAYQNLELTQLKIDNNPFAKGFRDKMRSVKARQEQLAGQAFRQGYSASLPSAYSFKAPISATMPSSSVVTSPFPAPAPYFSNGSLSPMINPVSGYPFYPIPTYPHLLPSFSYPSSVVEESTTSTSTEEDSN